LRLSKSAYKYLGSATRAALDDRRTYPLPSSRRIVALVGLEVCDGSHRLSVMKKSGGECYGPRRSLGRCAEEWGSAQTHSFAKSANEWGGIVVSQSISVRDGL